MSLAANLVAPWRSPLERGERAYAAGRFFRAFETFKRSREPDGGVAAFRLGRLYISGEGVQRNVAEAARWFREAAREGHAEAQLRLAQILLNGASGGPVARWREAAAAADEGLARRNAEAMFPAGLGVDRDPSEALEWLRAATAQGLAAAHALLGALLLEGRGVERDYAAAQVHLRQAAEAGVAVAQFHLGDMQARGLGCNADPAQAADLFERAAAQGHARAQLALATLLARGEGRTKDLAAAGALYEQAAAAGEPHALYCAGLMRLAGDGLERNLDRAEFHLRAAARKDHLPAIMALADFYSHSAGAAPNLREAHVWYRRAADLGDRRAQFIAGRLSATGAAANLEDAAKWFRRAAERGDALSAHNLACLLASGEAASVEPGEASRWFEVAAELGLPASQLAVAEARLAQGDSNGAREWLQRAAQAGDGQGKTGLAGLLLAEGDAAEAVRLLREAAEKGHAPAARWLWALHSGRASALGFVCDPTEAAHWLRVGAEAGDAECQFRLSEALCEAEGPASQEALTLLQRADAQGHAEASFALGVLYCTGKGVARDLVKGARCYARAAEAGLPLGMFNWGVMLANGQGVEIDVEAGRTWIDKAAKMGVTAARRAQEGKP